MEKEKLKKREKFSKMDRTICLYVVSILAMLVLSHALSRLRADIIDEMPRIVLQEYMASRGKIWSLISSGVFVQNDGLNVHKYRVMSEGKEYTVRIPMTMYWWMVDVTPEMP